MSLATRRSARFYDKTAWDAVSCKLCPHLCSIAPSRSGVCGVRTNRGGELFVDNYAKVTSLDILASDELPLYHFKPEATWMRISGKGCTMRCTFCNTYRFSQTGGVTTQPMPAESVADRARQRSVAGVSFGVNEPAPMHEFVEDVCREARSMGLATHLATSGMWSSDAFREITELTDAVTLGLKGLDEHFLQTQLGADRRTILNNLRIMLAIGAHVEVTWLVIPEVSDRQDQVEELVGICHQSEHPPPIILLPFVGDFTWEGRSRDARIEDLQRMHAMFDHYRGAVYEHHPESMSQDTRCEHCRRVLIRRGMSGLIVTPLVAQGKGRATCPMCGHRVPYVP